MSLPLAFHHVHCWRAVFCLLQLIQAHAAASKRRFSPSSSSSSAFSPLPPSSSFPLLLSLLFFWINKDECPIPSLRDGFGAPTGGRGRAQLVSHGHVPPIVWQVLLPKRWYVFRGNPRVWGRWLPFHRSYLRSNPLSRSVHHLSLQLIS